MDPSEIVASAPWEPPEKFKALMTSSIVGRLEAFRSCERDARRRVDADLSSRGLGRSGMAATALLEALRPDFERYAQGVVDDLLGHVRELYGTIPSESGPWIRETFEKRVTELAPRIAATIAEAQLNRVTAPGVRNRPWTEFNGAAFAAKRRMEQEILMSDLKAEMTKVQRVASAARTGAPTVDVFICHASEDKEDVALPLGLALEAEGFTVWIDKAQIKVGDDLLSKLDEGLRSSRFAVVIISPKFFGKHWTRIELSSLATLQEIRGRKVILPIWHNIDKVGIAEHSVLLASLYGLPTSSGITAIVAEITSVLREPPAS